MQNKTEVEELKEEMQRLREELDSLKHSPKEKAFGFEEKLESEELIKDFQEEFSKIKDKTDQVSSELKEQVKQNPLQSISIAFALGLVLSKVFGGRR